MEALRRCPLTIAQRLVRCVIALSTAVLDRVTKTMSVAPLLMNNLDNSKQKTSNLLSPAPPPYSWSLLGKSEGPAPPPSSKISWSFDLAWNPVALHPQAWTYIYRSMPEGSYRVQYPGFPKIVYCGVHSPAACTGDRSRQNVKSRSTLCDTCVVLPRRESLSKMYLLIFKEPLLLGRG